MADRDAVFAWADAVVADPWDTFGAGYQPASRDYLFEVQLAGGGRVELRGFGAFSTRQRDARVGRNPRTGEAVDVDAKRVPYFKPGKEMRERLKLNGAAE